MVKKLDAESAAKQVTEALQPVVDFRVSPPQAPLPENKPPASAEVRRALGILDKPTRKLP